MSDDFYRRFNHLFNTQTVELQKMRAKTDHKGRKLLKTPNLKNIIRDPRLDKMPKLRPLNLDQIALQPKLTENQRHYIRNGGNIYSKNGYKNPKTKDNFQEEKPILKETHKQYPEVPQSLREKHYQPKQLEQQPISKMRRDHNIFELGNHKNEIQNSPRKILRKRSRVNPTSINYAAGARIQSRERGRHNKSYELPAKNKDKPQIEDFDKMISRSELQRQKFSLRKSFVDQQPQRQQLIRRSDNMGGILGYDSSEFKRCLNLIEHNRAKSRQKSFEVKREVGVAQRIAREQRGGQNMIFGDYKDTFKQKEVSSRDRTPQYGYAAGVTSERRHDAFLRYYNKKTEDENQPTFQQKIKIEEKKVSQIPSYLDLKVNEREEQSELDVKDTGITEAFFDTQEKLLEKSSGLPLEYQKMRRDYELATFISEKCEFLRRKLEGIGSLEKRQTIIKDYLEDIKSSQIMNIGPQKWVAIKRRILNSTNFVRFLFV